jgi:hypothetical protein
VLEKVAMGVLNTGIVVGAIGVIASIAVATTIVPGAIIAGTSLGLKEGFKFKYKNKHKGIYTDAKRDQKILYSGIKEYQDTISKEEQKDLNKKLVYIRDKLIMPVKVVDLTDEQKKDISRIQEVTNKDSFNEKDSQKMVMGSKNWYMLFTECKSGITIEDVVMPGNSCLKKNNGKDSQEALLASLKQLVLAAKKNGREVNFNIANEKTNKFCERYSKDVLDKFDRSVEEKISKDRRNAIEKNKENEGIEISR